MIGNFTSYPSDTLVVVCALCDWRGMISETNHERFETTIQEWRMKAGREGVKFSCPQCNQTIATYFTRVS